MPDSDAAPLPPPERDAAWRSPLTALVLGAVLHLGATGLWSWIDPLSRGGQVQLLAHTAVGILALLPWARYQWIHLARTWRKPLSHHLVLGWASGVLLLAAMASGAVVTVQAGWGTRVAPAWHALHLGTGLASFALAAVHSLVAAVKPRGGFASPEALRSWTRAAGAAALGVALAAGGALAVPAPDPAIPFPEGYRRPYGDSPFGPSLARTSTGGAIDPAALSGSESCGTSGCHAEIVEEWTPSAHRWASRSKFFQAIQHGMAANNGPESTRYCAGCHDPIALFSGAKNLYDEDLSSAGADEGVSCAGCHSIAATDVRGNADYVLEPPVPYLFERGGAGRETPFLGRFLVRASPELHRKSYARDLLKTPEFCGACHKQFIDREVNGVGWVQLQNQYDNWRKSHWFVPDAEGKAGVSDPRRTVSCRECHMRLTDGGDPAAGDAGDYNRSPGDGKHRNHRFIGANQWHPVLHGMKGGEEQVRLTEEWLRGETEIPEIADKWATGPAVALEIQAPPRALPGEQVVLKIAVTSNKVGHDFPTGPLDIIQSWIEVVVADAGGREVFASGRVDDRGFIQEGAFLFKAEGVDRAGNLIDRHNLWEMVGARFRRSLFPGITDAGEFRFACPSALARTLPAAPGKEVEVGVPAEARGPLSVRARLRYRKVDQTLIEYLYPGQGITAPVTDMAEAAAVIEVGEP
ncbi:MAG: cytochrome c family protein [Planctomycetes bacterium]|nr:cytochrome c family protein [Planctomycetota bacterium]